jgi:uncharacterized protein YegJ (DUF2314 family)
MSVVTGTQPHAALHIFQEKMKTPFAEGSSRGTPWVALSWTFSPGAVIGFRLMKALLCGLALVFLASCARPAADQPETLVNEFDEAAMDAAIARARKETPAFLAALAKGDADSYSVKAPISEKGKTEHFWISDVTYQEGVFRGTIANEPGIVTHVKFGQAWTIKEGEISDWMVVQGERIHGGYTIDPLLPSFPKAEADALRNKLVR